VFAWIVVKILFARVLFEGEFVDQLNFCDLVIMPSFGLLAFSQNRISWHLLYFKIFFNFPKQEPRSISKTKALPKPEYL
jgi:hypothetical protein